ncbi:hypothetical protein CDD83_6708 [Cordyceps sp. RAO-2017]|nr:hypothetical protein CDD83_6708 [Cordyceps sp. RAO-2017]
MAVRTTERRPSSHRTSSNTSEKGEDDHGDGQGLKLPMSKAKCIALVATVTGAAFLNTLSIQSVVIILPTIGNELSVPECRQQWIVSSYSLTFGCFLLFWGRVADIYGMRLIFILGSVWVTIVTAANPFMPHEVAFDLFRGLHGLGAAANVPTAIGILGVTFPPGKAKNYAFSTYAVGAPLGNVFGNIVSGLIAEYSSWKWVFGASAIMAGAIAVAGIVFIPPRSKMEAFETAAPRTAAPSPATATTTSQMDDDVAVTTPPAGGHGGGYDGLEPRRSPLPAIPPQPPSVDWIGAVLITTSLTALMFALTEGNVVGWDTPWIPVIIVGSLLVIVAFVFWQRRLERLNRPDGGPP